MIPVTTDTLVSSLDQYQSLGQGISEYFRRGKCQCWEAIKKFMAECPPHECPFFDKTGPLVANRSYGYVHFNTAYLHPSGAEDPANTIRISCQAVVHDEEEETSYDVTGLIDIPIDLITNFQPETFDAWLKKICAVHRLHRLEIARTDIAKLHKEFPELEK